MHPMKPFVTADLPVRVSRLIFTLPLEAAHPLSYAILHIHKACDVTTSCRSVLSLDVKIYPGSKC